MKKTITILMAILMLSLTLSGCSSQDPGDKYSIKLSGFSDSVPEINHSREYFEWRKSRYVDDSREGSMSISVGDMVIEGEYSSSHRGGYACYDTHKYLMNGSVRGLFQIDDDGRLEHVVFLDVGAENIPETDPIYTEEECREIAFDFAKDFFDVSNYIVTSAYEEDNCLYSFSFNKYIDGFLCADYAKIWITKNGKLHTFSSNMLEKMPADDHVNFDLNEVDAQITRRLDEMYAGVKDSYDSIEYEFDKRTLTMDEDGNYALAVEVAVSFINKYGAKGYSSIGERLTFAVLEN